MSNGLSFNFSSVQTTDFSNGGGYQQDSNLWQCKSSNGKNNEYDAIIRFLPYMFDINKSKYTKNIVSVKNPMNPKEFLVFDCPRNNGKASIFSNLNEILRTIVNNNNKHDTAETAEIKKWFSRYMQSHSIVYIMTDNFNPSNQNTVKIFKYGSKINDILTDAEKGTGTIKPFKPFDLVNGKDFYYIAKKGFDTYDKYDGARFMDNNKPFQFLLPDGSMYYVAQEHLNAIEAGHTANQPIVWLYNEIVPKMDAYFHKDPSQETIAKACGYLRIILSRFPGIYNKLIEVTNDDFAKSCLVNAVGQASHFQIPTVGNTQFDINTNQVVENNAAQFTQQPAQQQVQQPVQQQQWSQPAPQQVQQPVQQQWSQPAPQQVQQPAQQQWTQPAPQQVYQPAQQQQLSQPAPQMPSLDGGFAPQPAMQHQPKNDLSFLDAPQEVNIDPRFANAMSTL